MITQAEVVLSEEYELDTFQDVYARLTTIDLAIYRLIKILWEMLFDLQHMLCQFLYNLIPHPQRKLLIFFCYDVRLISLHLIIRPEFPMEFFVLRRASNVYIGSLIRSSERQCMHDRTYDLDTRKLDISVDIRNDRAGTHCRNDDFAGRNFLGELYDGVSLEKLRVTVLLLGAGEGLFPVELGQNRGLVSNVIGDVHDRVHARIDELQYGYLPRLLLRLFQLRQEEYTEQHAGKCVDL